MSHYEQRLQQDLDRIKAEFAAVGGTVTEAVVRATRVFLTHDADLAAQAVLGDMPINRAIRDLDRHCHYFVARHLPSAGVLRFISSVLRLSIALERIGDYAASIARQTIQLHEPVPEQVARDVEVMSEQSVLMLEQSVKSFVEGNAELARGTKAMAKQVDSTFDRVFADLLREGGKQSRQLEDLFAILIAFNRLERISDQAKNICEETVFAVTGETKEPKVYKILFVDEKNDLWSPLAESMARRAYPESGRYASAGWAPADAVDPAFARLLSEKGFDAGAVRPKPLPATHEELDDYHIVVNLGRGLRSYIPEVPYKTLIVEWGIIPETEDDVTSEAVDDVQRKISVRLRDLMEILRGEDAS